MVHDGSKAYLGPVHTEEVVNDSCYAIAQHAEHDG